MTCDYDDIDAHINEDDFNNKGEDDDPPTWDEVVNQCGGHTEHAHQQITNCQVQDEEIGDRTHVAVPDDHQADKSVPYDTKEQHQQVREDVADRHPCWVDVIWQERAVVQSEVESWEVQGHFVYFGCWKEKWQFILVRYPYQFY